jgi:Zn-dependent protease with chaperone function
VRGRSAHQLYLLHLALGGVGAAVVAGGAVAVFSGTGVALPSAGEISEACDSWLSAGGPAALLGFAITAVALTVLGLGLRSARRQVRSSRSYLDALPIGEKEVIVDAVPCRVVAGKEPQAFCAGYLRPRIFLSEGALGQLTETELGAVVAHELHHVRRREPLRLLVATALADALFFLPILRRMSERYRALGELAADEAAVNALHARAPLASALLKFSEPEPVPEAVVGIDPERVDNLMGDDRAGRWRLPRTLLGRSVLVLGAMGGLVLLVWHGLLDPTLELPFLLAAVCMVLMVGGPVVLASAALLLSRRALRARRA